MIIVVDLQARTGTFVTDIDRSTKQAERAIKRMEAESKKALREFGRNLAIAGTAAIAGFAVLVRSIVKATTEAEKASAQLNAVLRSTGGAAGLSAAQLKGLADELQRTTTFEDDAIIASEALLLTFTKIGASVFPDAQRAILDVATAMGQDLQSATVQVGKALNDPILGLTALSKAGIQFSAAQRTTIKALVQTGQVAEAQRIILKELQTQFGGSAEAASRTFGGALTQLKNTLGNLLEGEGGSLNGASEAVNQLTETLNSPSVKAAFQSLTSLIFEATAAVVEFSASLIDLEGEGEKGIQTLAEIQNPAGIFERILQNLPDHIEGVIRKMIEWRRTTLDVIGAIDDLSPRLLLISEAQARTSGAFGGLIQRTTPADPTQGAGLTTGFINPLLSDEQIKAAKKAFEEARRLQEAFARGDAEIFQAGLDRQRQALEANLDLRQISYKGYLAEKLRLTEDEINAEIAAAEGLLQGAAKDEAVLLQARIQTLQIQREIARESKTQEEAKYARELAIAYEDAAAAAKSYVDEISREGQRTLAAFDQTPSQRRFSAGQFQIDDRFRSEREALDRDFSGGGIDQEQYDRQLQLLRNAHAQASSEWARYYDLIEEKQKDFTTGFNNALAEYVDATQNVGAALGDTLVHAIDDATHALARAGAELILFGESPREAIYQLARTISTELLSALIRVGIQAVLTKTLLAGIGGAGGSTGGASFGADYASTFGFATGGYTGDDPRNKISGVVHGQEFVVNADATRKNRDLLEAINSGETFDGAVSVPRSSSQGVKPSVNTRIINVPDKSYIKDYLMGEEGDEVFVNWVGRNSARIKSAVAS